MKNWKHYFSELIMLFAAVSAGFWVDNYRDEQSEREVLTKKLEAFVQEYEITTNYLDSLDFYAEFYLPGQYEAYEKLLRKNGTQEEYIKALSRFFNVIFLNIDPFDDLINFSSISERDEARFIENDSLINALLTLNDGIEVFEGLNKRRAEIDNRIIRLFSRHNMIPDMIYYNTVLYPLFDNFPPETDSTLYQFDIQYGFGENNEDYEPFGDIDGLLTDEELPVIVQEKYVLHVDAQGTLKQVLYSLNEAISLTRKELKKNK